MKCIILDKNIDSLDRIQDNTSSMYKNGPNHSPLNFKVIPPCYRKSYKRPNKIEKQITIPLPELKQSQRSTNHGRVSFPIKSKQVSIINSFSAAEEAFHRKHYRYYTYLFRLPNFRNSINDGPKFIDDDIRLMMFQPKPINNVIQRIRLRLDKLKKLVNKCAENDDNKAKIEYSKTDSDIKILQFQLILYDNEDELFDTLMIEMGKTEKIIRFKDLTIEKIERLNSYFNKAITSQEISFTQQPSIISLVKKSLMINQNLRFNDSTSICNSPSKTNETNKLVIKGVRSSIPISLVKNTELIDIKDKSESFVLSHNKNISLNIKKLPKGIIRANNKLKEQFLEDLLKAIDSTIKIKTLLNKIEIYITFTRKIIIKYKGNFQFKSFDMRTECNLEGQKQFLDFSKLLYKQLALKSKLKNLKTISSIDKTSSLRKKLELKLLSSKNNRNSRRIEKRKLTPIQTLCNSIDCDVKNITLPNTYIKKENKTLIKINHIDYKCHNDHPINQMIHIINKFNELIFKNKDGDYDMIECKKIAKILGISLNKDLMNPQTLKNRDLSYPIKDKILKQFWNLLNIQNNIVISVPEGSHQYKFCVCQGNNHMLVKSVLKYRSWWAPTSKNDEGLNLLWTQWYRPKFIKNLPSYAQSKDITKVFPLNSKICNHLEAQYHLSNKKAMFINMKYYFEATNQDIDNVLPLTYHIKNGLEDPEFKKFEEYFNKNSEKSKMKNVWIIKPGENTNRGYKIQVLNNIVEISKILSSVKKGRTYILQKYIEEPLLINKRKFDIRMYGMITSMNGCLKGYFYEEGYIRTSSKEYSLKNLSSKAIHLTNDAVQQKENDYGKFESGNKMSFADFQKYLDSSYKDLNIDFFKDLLPQIRKIVTDTFRSVHDIIDPCKRIQTFEIFGYDFMIDSNFKLYLIEINTNPCLEVSSPLLGRIITNMLDCALK